MPDSQTPKPIVVVSVMVLKEGKTLLNLRKGSFAADMYGVPGGKLDALETLEQCARRETLEEAGITISEPRFACLINNLQHAPQRHFINICLVADWVSGEPQVLEPEKCAHWGWCSFDALPQPMTHVTKCLVEAHKTGRTYFDAQPL